MDNLRTSAIRFLNALLIVVLSLVILGAYIYEFLYKKSPCPLCELQRLAMILICFGPLLNFKFGFRPLHYSISIFAALFGAIVSLRHIALHVCKEPLKTSVPVWGFQLYVWAFFVFGASILAIGLFLLIQEDSIKKVVKTNLFEKFSFLLVFTVTVANVVSAFWMCGFGFCIDK